jgi:integrase/recombinase XerD
VTDLTVSQLAELSGPMGPDTTAAAWLIGYTGETRRAYGSDLKDWASWLDRLNVQPFEAKRVHVEAWQRDLEQRFAASTVARRLSSVTSFYRYATDAELVTRNPCAGVRRPRVDVEPSTGLTRSEISALLSAAESSGVRNHCLALLLVLNGLRVTSALALDVGDVQTERGYRTIKVKAKGGKQLTFPLAPPTARAIDKLTEGRDEGPVFRTLSGKRWDRYAAYKQIRRLAELAGIQPIGPHTLRHSFATQALDAGVELHHVQDACGHADPRTTQRYNDSRFQLDKHPTHVLAARLL